MQARNEFSVVVCIRVIKLGSRRCERKAILRYSRRVRVLFVVPTQPEGSRREGLGIVKTCIGASIVWWRQVVSLRLSMHAVGSPGVAHVTVEFDIMN